MVKKIVVFQQKYYTYNGYLVHTIGVLEIPKKVTLPGTGIFLIFCTATI